MDYYTLRKKAFKDIDALLEAGAPFDSIVFKIATKYGLGEKIVKDRIEMIKKIQNLTENGEN